MAKLFFIESADGKPLAKVYDGPEVRPAPFVSAVNSMAEEVDPTDLAAFAGAMMKHAASGRAMLRGPLARDLFGESRAGSHDRRATSAWACLDIDGLPHEIAEQPQPYGDAALRAMAEAALGTVLDGEHIPPCVAHASASCGMKPGKLNLHLFLPLAAPIDPQSMKLWLRSVNFERPALERHMELSANGQSLKWPLDTCLADNSHLIFIAPPQFLGSAKDPFASPGDRWAAIGGGPLLDIASRAAFIEVEKLAELQRAKIGSLRKAAGLPRRNAKMASRNVGGEMLELLLNPDSMSIQVEDDSHPDYVRCNVNGGDSRGYYFLRRAPRYMYNFKGEPIWEIVKASEDFSREALDYLPPDPSGIVYRPQIIRDFRSNTFYAGLYDPGGKRFKRDYGLHMVTKSNFPDFLRSHGAYDVPDYVEDADMVFDPEAGEEPVDDSAMPWRVNLFRSTDYRREAPSLEGYDRPAIDNESAFLMLCPRVRLILLHVLGGDVVSLARFVNWLAYIYQTGRKTMAAWLISGDSGTGKGVTYQRVLRPIFGDGQVVYKELGNIEEQFNGYMRTAQFLIVDEYRADSANAYNSLLRLADKLKVQITEPTVTIREMRANQVEVKSYCNFIFFTNHVDAVRIPPDDRRYNVSPRQNQPLLEVYPNLASEFPLIEKELYNFAAILRDYDVIEHEAVTPMENDAKNTLIKGSVPMFDEVANAVHGGELPYFAEVLDMDATAVLGNAIPAAQRLVKRMVEDARMGRPTLLTMEELRNVFHVITDKRPQLASRQFRKEMGIRGLETKVIRDGLSQRRGIKIDWPSDAQFEAALIGRDQGSEDQTA